MWFQVESMGARVDSDSPENGKKWHLGAEMVACRDGRLGVHAEMVGSTFVVCGCGLPHVRKTCRPSYHACTLRRRIPPYSIRRNAWSCQVGACLRVSCCDAKEDKCHVEVEVSLPCGCALPWMRTTTSNSWQPPAMWEDMRKNREPQTHSAQSTHEGGEF